ncbi:MAG: CinA family protein [Candidatus Binataceae bacterium]
MQTLLPLAAKVGAVLKLRKETIAITESSSGGLISASLLSVARASAYFIGATVTYTRQSMHETLGLTDADFAEMRGLTEPTALVLARAIRARLSSSWAIAEIGASGPTGSRYGDPPGTSCIALVGPVERAIKVQTGSADRTANMRAFAQAALLLIDEVLAYA